MWHPSHSQCGGVWRGAPRKMIFTTVQRSRSPSLSHPTFVSTEVTWRAIMKHSYPSQLRRHQWRSSRKPEPSTPSSNKEPSPELATKAEYWTSTQPGNKEAVFPSLPLPLLECIRGSQLKQFKIQSLLIPKMSPFQLKFSHHTKELEYIILN